MTIKIEGVTATASQLNAIKTDLGVTVNKTASEFTTMVSGSSLAAGVLYYITDSKELYMATSTTAFDVIIPSSLTVSITDATDNYITI